MEPPISPSRYIIWLMVALCITTASLLATPSPAHGTLTAKIATTPLHYTHRQITTTVFWVGELSDSDNGYIPNQQSAWDGQWQQHYGGVDDAATRHGFAPAAFIPQENPFYIALPYNDISPADTRKPSAAACKAFSPTLTPDHSWCKNAWIAINYQGHTAYAQWEDVGPFEEDDAQYVFGVSRPYNIEGEKAGLDVSPAVRDYLQLGDVSSTDWHFVTPRSVPEGPWRARITKSLGYTIE